ncbi:MAG: hypothetical protein HYR92_02075, partial [Burkholderiales bacterium]|nr:hypothetical protein [Burkholderiales bacterium]
MSNNTPVTSDQTITVNENSDIILTASSFTFQDKDIGDKLMSVTIVKPPVSGTLRLFGVDVVSNQSISIADINAGGLRFTPAADTTGINYASFNFKV